MSAALGIFGRPEYEPGLYPGLSNAEYHRAPGISNSGLALMHRAPAIYYGRRLDPRRPREEAKPGQQEGTLAHCAILEPEALEERYAVGPDVRRNTNAWKEFVAAHPDREVIKPGQLAAAQAQAESVRSIPDVAEALASGQAEVSAFWRGSRGVLCKLRPDWVHSTPAGDILLDVKTCGDASPAEFRKQIARKLYHLQDAWYTDGWAAVTDRDVLGFLFVAVEVEYPYAASAVMLDEESRQEGRDLYHDLVDLYAQCRRDDHWPSYTEGIAEVRLPAWAFS